MDVAINADVNMVVTSTNQVWVWGYNGNLYGGHYDLENLPMVNVAASMTGAGVIFPLTQIAENYKCVQIIDANNHEFGIGNNQEGRSRRSVQATRVRT